MAIDETLIFSGTRWVAADITRRYNVPSLAGMVSPPPGVPLGDVLSGLYTPPTQCTIFTIEVAGNGRQWTATEPEAFWFSFSLLVDDFISGNGDGVLRFLGKHGDPFGALLHQKMTDTTSWVRAAVELGHVAQAWDPPDADGLSHLTKETDRLCEARETLRAMVRTSAGLFDFVPDPTTGLELVKRAKTLHGFMMMSAASAFRRGALLRMCRQCADVFEPGRSDAKFCSASCRAAFATAAARQKGE